MSSKPTIGIPPFNGKLKQLRGSGYTFERCVNDIIDNVLDKASQMIITITSNNQKKLNCITFSDNYEDGFVNIEESNASNPLNMAHDRVGHDEDNETSEFGIGLKASAVNLGEKLIIFTYVPKNKKYYQIELDFIKMSNNENPIESYEPTFFGPITQETFLIRHPFENGSSIIIENIREDITSIKECIKNLKGNLSKTFGRTDIKITLNSEVIEKPINYLDIQACKIFNTASIIYYNPQIFPIFVIYKCNKKYHFYVNGVLKNQKDDINVDVDVFINEDTTLKLEFISTFTWFFDKLQETKNMPDGKIALYRNNRLYGDIPNRRNNGKNNYTYHECNWISKKFNKLLGLTFSKNINLDIDNDLTEILTTIRHCHETNFSADTGTQIFNKLEEKAFSKKIIEKKICTYEKKKAEKAAVNKAAADEAIAKKAAYDKAIAKKAAADKTKEIKVLYADKAKEMKALYTEKIIDDKAAAKKEDSGEDSVEDSEEDSIEDSDEDSIEDSVEDSIEDSEEESKKKKIFKDFVKKVKEPEIESQVSDKTQNDPPKSIITDEELTSQHAINDGFNQSDDKPVVKESSEDSNDITIVHCKKLDTYNTWYTALKNTFKDGITEENINDFTKFINDFTK